MKALSITALLLLTLTAYGATTVIFDGQNLKHPLSDQNEDYGLSTFSQETIDDGSDLSSDWTDIINTTDNAARIPERKNFEFVKNTQNIKNNFNDGNSNENYQNPHNRVSENNNQNVDNHGFSSNSNWSHDQSERSNESFQATDESGELHGFEHETTTDDGSATIGRYVVDKIAALDRIVVQEHQCRENLLDVRGPVPVDKSVVKVSRRHFVSFRNAELRDLDGGRLEYLSVDAANGRVYAECAFDRLTAAGDFKTNLEHTRAGRFAVDMTAVRGNVTAASGRRRRGGPAAARPAIASAGVAVRVLADDARDAAAVEDAVARKYRGVLERAVFAAASGAARRGLAARLAAEMTAAWGAPDDAGRSAPFRMNRTEGDVTATLTAAGWSGGPGTGRRAVDAVSYARRGRSYETRYDADLGAMRWTGVELAVTCGGGGRSSATYRAPEMTADSVRARVVVRRSLVGHGCGRVEALVRVHGLRYVPDGQGEGLAGPAAAVGHGKLSAMIGRSLGARVKSLLVRDVCDGRIAGDVV